ncbi:fimbrial protein [Mixta mediterraneensis]|uniref:fimbrial protein n=1 Tax=Mixta mediterraneensis TaxID=2758443 RepID=UPI001874EFCA|nr:fimbrial protein [Mixta mediterraneensis]
MSILTESGIPEPTLTSRTASVFAAALRSLILSLLMPLTHAHAKGVLGEVNIRLSGTVVALGCTVNPNDVDKPVQLGEWTTKQLKKAGEKTSPVPFSIHLTGCTASGVTTAFTGQKDRVNPELLALRSVGDDYATGIAVQIMDSSGQRIPISNNSTRQVVDENGNVTLNFQASYVTTSNNVRPGTADADTEFTLTYD